MTPNRISETIRWPGQDRKGLGPPWISLCRSRKPPFETSCAISPAGASARWLVSWSWRGATRCRSSTRLSALEFGRVNIAGRAVGVAQASLDRALDYARERHAFGRPISEFQAIQLKLADMATEVQAARLLTWWAASALDSGSRADLETGMAKLYASEVCIKASLEAMRIHGGYGYSTEYEIERFYRDAPLMAIGEGTNDILRTVIARHLIREQHS